MWRVWLDRGELGPVRVQITAPFHKPWRPHAWSSAWDYCLHSPSCNHTLSFSRPPIKNTRPELYAMAAAFSLSLSRPAPLLPFRLQPSSLFHSSSLRHNPCCRLIVPSTVFSPTLPRPLRSLPPRHRSASVVASAQSNLLKGSFFLLFADPVRSAHLVFAVMPNRRVGWGLKFWSFSFVDSHSDGIQDWEGWHWCWHQSLSGISFIHSTCYNVINVCSFWSVEILCFWLELGFGAKTRSEDLCSCCCSGRWSFPSQVIHFYCIFRVGKLLDICIAEVSMVLMTNLYFEIRRWWDLYTSCL